MFKPALFVFGVALLLWGAWDNTKNPSDPEPLTWTGLAVRAVFLLFFHVLLSICMNMLGEY